jgi:hypothetical protein
LKVIAEEHGVTKQAVSLVLRTKFGIPVREIRRAAARERERKKLEARKEALRRRIKAAKAVDKLMAKGMPFRRAFMKITDEMGHVASHFTIRALTTSEARYGRFQKDLPERRAKAVRLVRRGASFAQAANEVRLATATVARLWREWKAAQRQ